MENRAVTMSQRLEWPNSLSDWQSFLSKWGLEPDVAVLALALGHYSRAILGVTLYITSGHRSPLRQQQLRDAYARGDPGVYKPAAGTSPHEKRRAFDADPEPNITDAQWRQVGMLAELLGLRWGGRFGTWGNKASGWDPVHFDKL